MHLQPYDAKLELRVTFTSYTSLLATAYYSIIWQRCEVSIEASISVMDSYSSEPSAAQCVLGSPELLAHILSYLLCQLLPLTDQEDPRSVRVYGNARILKQLLRCSEVNWTWYRCILQDSKQFRDALFLQPNEHSTRPWDFGVGATRATRLHSYCTTPHQRAPRLNPIIQTTFGPYHFRFWHLNPASSGNRHVAYLIITRKNIPAVSLRSSTGQGRTISRMLLSQPPPTAMEATIWEERDETRDYVGRTTSLRDPVIRCTTGVTIGLVHDMVSKMFDEYRDVAAIKLTTT